MKTVTLGFFPNNFKSLFELDGKFLSEGCDN